MPYLSLMVYKYIVVDIVLYLYVLPNDHLLTSYSSLCLSYNLCQAQDHNRNLVSTFTDPILGWHAPPLLNSIIINKEEEWKVEQVLDSH